jgi:hypothetical protein
MTSIYGLGKKQKMIVFILVFLERPLVINDLCRSIFIYKIFYEQ